MDENAILNKGMNPGEAGAALYRLAEALESEAARVNASAAKARRLANEYQAAVEGALETVHHGLLEGWAAEEDGELRAWAERLRGGEREGREDDGEAPTA